MNSEILRSEEILQKALTAILPLYRMGTREVPRDKWKQICEMAQEWWNNRAPTPTQAAFKAQFLPANQATEAELDWVPETDPEEFQKTLDQAAGILDKTYKYPMPKSVLQETSAIVAIFQKVLGWEKPSGLPSTALMAVLWPGVAELLCNPKVDNRPTTMGNTRCPEPPERVRQYEEAIKDLDFLRD